MQAFTFKKKLSLFSQYHKNNQDGKRKTEEGKLIFKNMLHESTFTLITEKSLLGKITLFLHINTNLNNLKTSQYRS